MKESGVKIIMKKIIKTPKRLTNKQTNPKIVEGLGMVGIDNERQFEAVLSESRITDGNAHQADVVPVITAN